MRHISRLVSIAGVLAVWISAAHGQTAARITGTVMDQNRKPVAGAAIDGTGQRTATHHTLVADNEGSFTLAEIPPDSYQITATCNSCNDVSVIVDVAAGQTRIVALKLNTGSTSTEISVDKRGATMETTSARIGFNETAPEIAALPVNGLTFAPLALTAPFVANAGGAAPEDLHISGQSDQQNRYRLDGIDLSAIASSSPQFSPARGVEFRLRTGVNNIQEFRADSGMTLAEDGFASSGQIKLLSRSGGSDWHSSAYEYFRNNRLSARNFFDPGEASKLNMNQFGGDLGGPVVKDRLFAFGSYEQLRQIAGVNVYETVPSLSAREDADPSVASLFSSIPLGTATEDADVAIANRSARASQNESNLNFRLDYLWNLKNRSFARYSRSNGSEAAPDQSVSSRSITARTRPDQFVVGLNSELNASLINQLTAGLNRAPTSVAADAGIAGLSSSRLFAGSGAGSTVVSPGGLIQLAGGGYGREANYWGRSWNLIDNLDWLHGQHTVRTGVDFRMQTLPFERLRGTTYHYVSLDTLLADTDADITYAADLPLRVAEAKQAGAYIEDEWRIRPTLTFTFGARYEYLSAPSEQQNRASIFELSTFAFHQAHGGFYSVSKAGFVPRAGLAWAPNRLRGNTVIRAGAGIYQGPPALLDTIQPILNGAVPEFFRARTFPLTLDELAGERGISMPYGLDTTSFGHPQRNYAYSVSLQQALPASMTAQIAYLGVMSRHLPQQGLANLATAIDPESGDAIRPHDDFSAIQYITNGGNSSYQALQVGVSRRLVNGPTFAASYNFAHGIGDTLGAGGTQAAQNPTCLACERASNNFDIRQTFGLSSVYALPFGANRKYFSHGAKAILASGWSLAASWNVRSGLPVNVLIERSDEIYFLNGAWYSPAGDVPAGARAVPNIPFAGEAQGVQRPNLVSGVDPYASSGGKRFLNPAAFSIPLPGTVGNLGRNALRGPGFNQLDLQISRTFRLSEKQQMELRGEAFNLPNHTNFANPNSILPDDVVDLQPGSALNTKLAANFGLLGSTVGRTVGLGTSRQLELSLRYRF